MSEQTPTPTVLWLTSRSAFERGTQFCPFARYVENHAGPYGYGMQRKAQSIPLVTGSYTHLAVQLILQWLMDARQTSGSQPDTAPDEVIRWAIQESILKYRRVVEKRGILTLVADDEATLAKLTLLHKEQEYLIQGMIWAWALVRLPLYLQDYVIISVEEEESYVTGCTCALGNGLGEIEDHEIRGCNGIGILSRPDVLGQRKSDGVYGYTEFKTASVAKKRWNDSWERKQQFLLGILGAERRHGVEISHAWVEGLIKGQRKPDYPYTEDMPRLQQSLLCYAYFKPGIPPTSENEWRPGYSYYDLEGIKHTADKKQGYRKVALWEHPEEVSFPGKPEEMTVSEYWCKILAADFPMSLQKCVSLIGPIPKQRHQIEKALRSMEAEETLWQDRLWRIYEFSTQTGKQWGDDEFMEFVETVVPRSWNCDPFGPDHPCPNIPVCHPVTDDWRRPIDTGLFVYRAPHHLAEAEQMKARGLLPEDGYAEELDEVEGGDLGSDE